MNVTLRQNVISGESTKMNSPESFLASRILIADPDQSPAALEFELRRIRSKSRWKRIGCFVCGVFTLPVLILLGAFVINLLENLNW